jgi:Tfp pilus assembly protein PilF
VAAAAAKTSTPPRPAAPVRKTPEQNAVATHTAAVQVFQRGFEALQQRDFARACSLLQSLVTDFPDEKELHDRARVYLAICERQATPKAATPKTIEERIYSATVTINQGGYDEGLSLLSALEGEAPEHDHVQYMLAVVHTLRGQADAAVPHLERAIELNEQNRYLASQDADLELLRQHDGVATLLEAPPHSRRSAPRPRFVR